MRLTCVLFMVREHGCTQTSFDHRARATRAVFTGSADRATVDGP